MLADIVERSGTPLPAVVSGAADYFRRHQLPDGSIAEEPSEIVFHIWDTVYALKTMVSWRRLIPSEAASTTDAAVARVLDYLASREKPSGMVSFGEDPIGVNEYDPETTSEYIVSLARLGLADQARQKAEYLRSRQFPAGNWELPHPFIPKAFRYSPSVTGFCMMALEAADVEPAYPGEALEFLARNQTARGDFGLNRFYYNTPLYFVRPATATLARFGCHAAVAAARDFLLAYQSEDGSWPATSDLIDNHVAAELRTGLALEALAHAGVLADEAPVRRAIAWLMARRRPDGSWAGGRYPYTVREGYPDVRVQMDVYTTSQILAAFWHLASAEAAA